MSLTDDWKNKNLATKKDYFISDNNEILVAYLDDENVFYSGDDFIYDETCDFIEVLTPCDYEELQHLKSENKTHTRQLGNQGYRIHNQRHEISNRINEIKKLRTLLKECVPYIKEDCEIPLSVGHYPELQYDLLDRINTAIGDNLPPTEIQDNPVDCNKIQENVKGKRKS